MNCHSQGDGSRWLLMEKCWDRKPEHGSDKLCLYTWDPLSSCVTGPEPSTSQRRNKSFPVYEADRQRGDSDLLLDVVNSVPDSLWICFVWFVRFLVLNLLPVSNSLFPTKTMVDTFSWKHGQWVQLYLRRNTDSFTSPRSCLPPGLLLCLFFLLGILRTLLRPYFILLPLVVLQPQGLRLDFLEKCLCYPFRRKPTVMGSFYRQLALV